MATNTVQYFPLSQLHQEIDDTLMGAVRFNADQELTDTQKAQARENIGAVSFGSNLKILGHFDTVTELQESAPQNVGDAYSVGATTPYNLYIFDGLRNEWLDYGQIRAADISSRYVENQVIAVSAWTQDETALAGYSYKAQITVSGATGDDFPIVAFNQSDAVSGNFAPLAFSFDGYLEIFAKTKPTAAVTIPIATVIVNGGNGRGITNATGGIAAGSIKTADLADGSVIASKVGNGEITRAKLADEVLVTQIVQVGATSTATRVGIGKMFRMSNGSTDYVINFVKNADIPIGATFAIFKNWAKSNKIVFANNCKVAFKGEMNYLTAPTFTITDTFTLVAVQKITSDSNYDYWYISGDVEVVT